MFRSPTDVTRTVLEHEDFEETTLYQCSYCSEECSSETEVVVHQGDTHRKDLDNLFMDQSKHICKMCLSELPNRDLLIRHIKSDHLLSSETALRVAFDIYVCDFCGTIFFNKILLSYHIQHSHTKKKPKKIRCPSCFKKINFNIAWYHFRTHGLQSIVCCRICCKKLNNRIRLAEHLKGHRPCFKCEICSYETTKELMFEIHIKRFHKHPNVAYDGTKVDLDRYFIPRQVPEYWKMLNLMGWRGIKLTNGVRICVLCREICTDKESMARHISIDHMDPKADTNNYLCNCGLRFSSKVLLKHHRFKVKDCTSTDL